MNSFNKSTFTMACAVLLAALFIRQWSMAAQVPAVTSVASVSAASYSAVVAPESIVAAFSDNLPATVSRRTGFDNLRAYIKS